MAFASKSIPPILKAVALSLCGIFLLDSMGAIIKHLGPHYPAPLLSTFRNLFGLVPSLIVLLASVGLAGFTASFRMKRWKLAIGRGFFVTFAQFCFYTSLLHLEYATATTLSFAGPMFVTAFSMPVLGDRVGVWRWSAVMIGFAGLIMIMRPGSDVFSLYALLPVLAAAGYAASAVTVRLITEPVPSASINLLSTFGALIGAVGVMLATDGYVPIASALDLAWIIAMGAAGGTGVLFLIMAYRMTKPSNLAPFDYFGILFALALGWIFFDEMPLDRLFPGVVFIVAGGALIIWRERRQKTE